MAASGDDQDLKSQVSELRLGNVPFERRFERADRFRYRFYLGLLVFVVIAGLPIVGVPALRHRLSSRVQLLREAVRPNQAPVPVMARVGENPGEFPKEYEIPVLPRTSAVPYFVPTPDRVYGRSETKVITAPSGTGSGTDNTAAPEQESAAEPEPVYGKGKLEQEAYDLLVKSNETVAGMIQGKDPSLRFKEWAAAKTEDDVFLVRLTFTQVSEKTEIPYIWQVKVVSKQVTPLNYYARSVLK